MRAIGLRLVSLVPVLFLVSLCTFSLTELLPGDTALAVVGEAARPEQIAAVREALQLDDPFPERYLRWLGGALRGDLGDSLRTKEPVIDAIRVRLPVNAEIALLVVVLSVTIAVPLGAWSAFRAGGLFDRIGTSAAFGLSALPPFVSALLLVAMFAVSWRLFPVSQWVPWRDGSVDHLRHLALPVLTLSLQEVAVYSQLLRADMVTVLQEDHVLAARSRGLPIRHILLREALRPASFSLVTLAAVSAGRLIAGTVIVEQIFALPGLGQMTIQAIPAKDFPMLQGGVLVMATVYLLLNLAADVAYPLLDPRVRRRHRA